VTSSGRPLAYRQIKVADGEILVRGECLFQGYLTGTGVERTIGINEWFGTRDLGSIDPEGYLTVVGRKDNMFLSGGENIQPEEIEEALMNIGRIYDAVVVPMTDEEYGERPVAFVQVHPDTELDEEAIQRSLREILPGFKVPSRILPFPSTETKAGIKFSRKELRAFAVQLLGKRS
jgi:O-succinylbenzoic acid--CoA ligase